MKKLKYLLLLPMLLVTSCGAKNICGVYGFAMGNVGGSHFGMYATLKADAYVDPITGQPDLVKKQFSLDLDLPLDVLAEGVTTKSTKEMPNYVSTYDVDPDSTDIGTIEGYYYSGTETDDGLEIRIGVGMIDKIFEELFHWEITSSDVMELIVCAYITDGVLNIRIPVSLEDLQMQLVWYGFYVDLSGTIPSFVDLFTISPNFWPTIEGIPTNEKRKQLIGTIPDKNAIEQINMLVSTHKDVFGDDFTFRVHHIVNLGLTKL